MANFKPTYGSFVAKGIVTGLDRDNAFSEGQKNGGKPWKKAQFGIKVSETQFVYVELMGAKMDSVKFVYRDPTDKKVDNGNYYNIPWAERYKQQKENYEMSMAVSAGLERDADGKKAKENKALTSYDAVDYIKKYLKNGESVYVRGALQITEYNGKPQEKYVIQKIYVTSDLIDLKAEKFEPEASFNQEIVFTGVSEDYATGKHFIETNIIYKKDGQLTYVPYSFTLDTKKYKNDSEKYPRIKKVLESFNGLEFGSTIRVNGNILVGAVMQQVTVADTNDFGGFSAHGQESFVKETVKELEITGGDGKTLIRGLYSEDDFYNHNSNNGDPFADDGKPIDISDDDLPF